MLSIRNKNKKNNSYQPQTYEHVCMCMIFLFLSYGDLVWKYIFLLFLFLLQIIQLAAPVRTMENKFFFIPPVHKLHIAIFYGVITALKDNCTQNHNIWSLDYTKEVNFTFIWPSFQTEFALWFSGNSRLKIALSWGNPCYGLSGCNS